MSVRVAIVGPAWFPVPPPAYGGIEMVVSLLADGLVEAGHDVTLFACGGSRTRARLVVTLDEPPDPSEIGNAWIDGTHAAIAYEQCEGYDLVHDHAAVAGPACGMLLRDTPVMHTLHGPWTPSTRAFYEAVSRHVGLVAISDAQRADNPAVPYLARVHNGIDVTAYPFREDKDDVLVYIGRATPDKGPCEAIDIARRVGLPLEMILKRSEPPERAYFEREIAPLLGSDITVRENVAHPDKVDLLGRARAMVFPIRWPEPFGLVMVEAMACGTPVITTNWGAAPEVVIDGVTGFRRDRTEDLVEAVGRVGTLDPAACRRRVVDHFSGAAMVRAYEAVYARVGAGAPGPAGFTLHT